MTQQDEMAARGQMMTTLHGVLSKMGTEIEHFGRALHGLSSGRIRIRDGAISVPSQHSHQELISIQPTSFDLERIQQLLGEYEDINRRQRLLRKQLEDIGFLPRQV